MSTKRRQPDTGWIEILRAQCLTQSQKTVAKAIGYSPTVVNQVLKGTYKGDLKRVQAAVEGALMQSEVECPVCGPIPRQRCVEHQRKPFTPTTPMNVALYRACRGPCPHALTNSNSAKVTQSRSAQPAVAHNTGSHDSVPILHAETGPTGRRKRLPHSNQDEV